jgi:hypothetical protein
MKLLDKAKIPITSDFDPNPFLFGYVGRINNPNYSID